MIYDFLVIGGGMAGVSAAYELSAKGSVLLLEAEDALGHHATGRSAALFTRNYGSPVVRRVNAASADFFRTPPPGFCETPLLSPRGSLTVAPEGLEDTLEASLALSQPGEEIRRITPFDALEMAPFLRPERVSAAVYEANVSDIDVATLHQSYVRGAKARGAVILPKQEVVALSQEASVWTATTAKEQFSAACIVNATGAWADRVGALVGARTIGLVPKRRSAILIKLPPVLEGISLPAIDFAGTDAYIKPDAGRLMVSPGDATPTDPHDAWADDMDIAELVDWIERETTIEVARVDHSWAGLRSFVADGDPVVGFDPDVPGFFWLAAQGGYGIMMAPVLAELTADLCTGSATARTAALAHDLSPDRLRNSRLSSRKRTKEGR